MADDWFVKIDNKVESGPISSDTLKQLALEGRIKPDTPLKKGPSGNWIAAGSIKGLAFPTAPIQGRPLLPVTCSGPRHGTRPLRQLPTASTRPRDLVRAMHHARTTNS